MTPLGYLLSEDIRRFRVVLCVVVTVLSTAVFVDWLRPLVAIDRTASESFNIVASLLWLTELLLTLAIVPLVIQSDSPVGSDAFWMTRPIPPRVLLAAKGMLLASLLVVLPALLEAALMAAHDVPIGANGAVVLQSMMFGSFWLIVLMVGGALTRNLARFALLCGGVLVSVSVALALTTMIMFARLEDRAVPFSSGPVQEDTTPAIVGVVLLILAGVTVLSVHYSTRSRVRAILLGGALVTGALLSASVWPWPVFARQLELPATADAIELTVDPATVTTASQPFSGGRATQWTQTRGRMSINGMPPDWSASIGLMQAALTLDGERILRSEGGGYTSALRIGGQAEYPTRVVTRALLEVDRLSDMVPPMDEAQVLLWLRETVLQRHAPGRGDYRATFNVTLSRHRIEAVLPLRPGVVHANGACRVEIKDSRFAGGHVAIVVRRSNATWLWAGRPVPTYVFLLRNPSRREAIAGGAHDLSGEPAFGRLLPFGSFSVGHGGESAGFHTVATSISFPAGYGTQGEAIALDEHWVSGAELVVVSTTQEGSIVRSVTVPAFPLHTAQKSASTTAQ